MSHLPKKAQRAIDEANRRRSATLGQDNILAKGSANPTYLNITTMNNAYCRCFDVWFNDVKQTLCKAADSKQGFIVRYLHGDKRNRPLPPYETETLRGKVEIRRKGT